VALVESELWRRRKQPQKARELIEKSAANADATQRYRVLQQLATIDAAGDPVRAAETLSTMAKEYPNDLWPLEQLAEIALTQNDFSALQKYEEALKRLEGNEGSLWRFYRGMRLARLSSGLNEAQ